VALFIYHNKYVFLGLMYNMKFRELNKTTRILCAILSLYLLNLSIDTPTVYDVNGNKKHFNEQDSFIELIVEKALAYEDAIEDYDSNDSSETFTKKSLVDFFIIPSLEGIQCNFSKSDKYEPFNLKQFNPSLISICFSPPPEV